MFRRNRKLKNATAGVMETPSPRTTINQAPPNYAAPLIVVFLFAMALLPVGFWMLVYLADTAGFENPKKIVANLLIYGLCILPIFAAALFAVAHFVSTYFEHRERLADKYGEWDVKRAMAARQLVGNTRTMGEDLRFVRLVEHVMMEAYHHIESSGQYTKNDAKPWARNQATKVVLVNEREPVGWKMGNRVRSWLQDRDVLKGDTVNLTRFPDIGSIQELLRLQYEIPINLPSPPLLDRPDYSFIDNSS